MLLLCNHKICCRVKMPSCAVYGCNNYTKSKTLQVVKYYTFPKNALFKAKWIKACGRKDKLNLNNATICSEHFASDCFSKSLQQELLGYSPKRSRNISFDAIPTEKLPFPNPKRVSTSETKRRERMELRARKEVVEELFAEQVPEDELSQIAVKNEELGQEKKLSKEERKNLLLQVVPPPVPVKLIKVLAVGQLQSIVGQGSAMQYGRNLLKKNTKTPPPSTEAESDLTSDNDDVEIQIDCHPDILVKEEIVAEDGPNQEASDPLADTITIKEVHSDVTAAWEENRTGLRTEENEEAPTPVPVKLVHVFTGKEVHSDIYPTSAMCEEENLDTSDTEVPMVTIKTEPIDAYDEEAEVKEEADSCGSS